MKAEIIAVGSELLTPDRLDTNSLFLTEELNKLGIQVLRKTIVGDQREELTDAFAGALKRVELVISCGGLGPAVMLAAGMLRRTTPSHQFSRSSGEAGRRPVSMSGFPQCGHWFPCLASRAPVTVSSGGPCFLRRFSQYPARSGSSGDDRPLTMTCRRMPVHSCLSR